jgi:hypothetical protein
MPDAGEAYQRKSWRLNRPPRWPAAASLLRASESLRDGVLRELPIAVCPGPRRRLAKHHLFSGLAKHLWHGQAQFQRETLDLIVNSVRQWHFGRFHVAKLTRLQVPGKNALGQQCCVRFGQHDRRAELRSEKAMGTNTRLSLLRESIRSDVLAMPHGALNPLSRWKGDEQARI